MTTFEFTSEDRDLDSTLVEDAWYNSTTREAVLNLHGWAYKYSNVGLWDYDGLLEADSIGSEYANFKNSFGPAEALGWTDKIQFTKAATVTAPSVGAPQNWTLSDNAIVSDSVVTSNPSTVTYTPLAPVATLPPAKEFKYTVHFDVEDGAKDKSYTTNAVDVNSAIDALTEVADMLDITIKVTSATVYFD